MLLPKKPLSALLAILLLLQQGAFASELDMARALDVRRFPVVKTDSAEPVKLESSALEKLEKFNIKTGSTWRIRVNGATKMPRSLVGGRSVKVGSSDRNALKFIKSNKDLLGVNEKDLKLLRKPLKSDIGTHYYFRQYYKDLPVENAYVKVNVDKSGALINYQSTYIPDLDIDVNEDISASSASSIAAQDAGGTLLNTPQKVIYVKPDSAEANLAWKMLIQGGESSPAKWDYYIDAKTGDILNRISKVLYASRDTNFSININPVYPKAPGISTQTLPLRDMYVYSFEDNQPQPPVTTDASGKVSTSGRMWATFSGPYFTVTNEAALTNYYVEKGLDENFSTNLWTQFTKGVNWTTYNACDTAGEYPVFAYPLITNFNLGAMNSAGNITDKKFLLLGSQLPENRILGAYIGRFSSINGPLISNQSQSQIMNITGYPETPGDKDYQINNFRKLCVPSSTPSRYTSTDTAAMSVSLADDNIQNPEAVAFYNLNAMRSYFLGLAGANFNLNDHIPVMVNASGARYSSHDNGMMNAFYDLDANLILVGQGYYDISKGEYKNFALESAIVRHEYVHAVMNKIWPIIYFDEGAAIAEAVSDYFALSSNTNSSGEPYTSIIGAYVAADSGEGVQRNLDGTDSYTAEKWVANGAPMGQHANSKFLSQALWDLRKTASGVSAQADSLVWNALMFFPDSLLEFRDAMVAVATVKGGAGSALVNAVEAAFNAHGLTYDNIITAKGDIYEPNNGPGSAADIDVGSISKKELNARINPASDMDYYSISLPAGEFKAVLTMPKIKNGMYIPLGMLLLDANMQTAVDLVRPADVADDQQGNTGITTTYETITLTFNAPQLLANENTGRYILGVYKLSNGYYPVEVTEDTGAYKINFTFAKGSNVGDVEAQLDDFADGQKITFSVPFATTGQDNGLTDTLTDLGLGEWAPMSYEFFHSARLLDSDLNPIPGASTEDANYLDIPRSMSITNNIMSGDVTIQNGFSSLGYNMVYLQVFGKLRSNQANKDDPNPEYRDKYGVVSLGISNPIVTKSTSGQEVFIREAVFNPMKGGKVKMEIVPKEDGKIKVQIYTIDGLLVKTIKDGDVQKGLTQIIEWDGRNGNGNIVASSVYLLRVDGAGIDRKLKKIVVVK